MDSIEVVAVVASAMMLFWGAWTVWRNRDE